MADVNFFDAFGYKWALVGSTENLQDDQYKVGWSFIGAVPPSVEQFNRVHQVADEKANWLYSQMASVFTAAGEVPTEADLNSLRDALRGLGLFQTAVTGTNDTKAATTAFVQQELAVSPGRLIAVKAYGGSSTYTPTAGTKFIQIEGIGGGGAGGGAQATDGTSVACGSGGASGSWGRAYGPVPVGSVAVTIGAGGAGVVGGFDGGSGGATSFGSIVSFPGGGGGKPAATSTSGFGFAGQSFPGAAPSGSLGANLFGSAGQPGNLGRMTSGAVDSGQGAAGPYGGGGTNTATGNGNPANGYGAGGSGGASGPSEGAKAGGAGRAGLILVYEYA